MMTSPVCCNALDGRANRLLPKGEFESQIPTANNTSTSNRHPSSSPSSFVTTSSSTSNSSLNQLNSLTPLSMGASSSCNNSSSSSSSSFSSPAFTRFGENVTTQTVQNTPDLCQSLSRGRRGEDNDQSLPGPQDNTRENRAVDDHRLANGLAYTNLLRKTSITPTQQQYRHPLSQMSHSYTLHSLDPKPLKPFKSNSEYLEAMKEDLAEWLNRLYADLDLNTENFFSSLETGSIICRHANCVTQMGRDYLVSQQGSPTASDELFSSESDNFDGEPNNNHSITSLCRETKSLSITSSNSVGWFSSSSDTQRDIDWFRIKRVPFKNDVASGTFFARDNICQFILWCRSLKIRECLLFETDDLVSRKNVKSFILCLLEVARIGFKVGMPTPLIIQLEQEIDREIEKDAKLAKQLEKEKEKRIQDSDNSEDSLVSDFSDDGVRFNDHKVDIKHAVIDDDTVKDETGLDEPPRDREQDDSCDRAGEKSKAGVYRKEEEQQQQQQEEYGPKPQVITNDLLSLHERVVQLLCQCTCPKQFPMERIGDNGKYKVGDKLIIFVRILRRHIMVRVGGGWQELSEFLRLKDPCRSRLYQPQSIANHHHQSVIPSVNSHQQYYQNKFGLTPHSILPRSRLGDSSYSNIPCRTSLDSASNGRGQHRMISSSVSMSWLTPN